MLHRQNVSGQARKRSKGPGGTTTHCGSTLQGNKYRRNVPVEKSAAGHKYILVLLDYATSTNRPKDKFHLTVDEGAVRTTGRVLKGIGVSPSNQWTGQTV